MHRGNVCQELIKFFSEKENASPVGTTFEVKMLKNDGTAELAEDNGGVLRDALTEFMTVSICSTPLVTQLQYLC